MRLTGTSLVLISLIISSFFSVPLNALEAVHIDDSVCIKNISGSVEYIEDKNWKLTFDDVRMGRGPSWSRIDGNYVNFGYSRSQFWFRLSLHNSTQKIIERLIEINFSFIDVVNFYLPARNGKFIKKDNGYSFPFNNREIKHRNNIFTLKQSPGTATYYLRLNCSGTISFNINILSHDSFSKRIQQDLPIYFIYYGFMLAMFFYNIFIFVQLREKEYLFFSFFVLSLILFELDFKGFAFQYLWPDSIWWAKHSIAVLILILAGSGTIFLTEFVSLKSHNKRASQIILYGFTVPIFVLAIASLFFDIQIGIITSLIMGLLCTIVCLTIGLYLSFIQPPSRHARIAILSFFPLAFSIPVVILTALGFLPVNFFTRWALQLGSSSVVIALSLALADKINQMKITIQKTEMKYHHLVESSTDIIFSLDEDLNFLSVNSALKKHLGYTADEILDTNFLDLVKDAFSDRVNIARQVAAEYIADLQRDKKRVTFRTTFKSKYGFEPKELVIKLEHAISVDMDYKIQGTASPIIDDTLLQFLQKESFTYSMNNYMSNADLMGHRLSRNLEKYLNTSDVLKIRIGIRESIINAIEHGNLNINFDDKTDSLLNEKYRHIISERQKDPKYKEKKVTIEYALTEEKIFYKISDQGEGFDYSPFLDFDIDSAISNNGFLPHGRGLLLMKQVFDELKFNEKGNQVIMVKHLRKAV